MDDSNRREHIRTALNARVRVSHSEYEPRVFATRDISDGGIFIVVEEEAFDVTLGDQVQVQVQGLPVEAPVLEMVIVRKTADGYGLQFAE